MLHKKLLDRVKRIVFWFALIALVPSFAGVFSGTQFGHGQNDTIAYAIVFFACVYLLSKYLFEKREE